MYKIHRCDYTTTMRIEKLNVPVIEKEQKAHQEEYRIYDQWDMDTELMEGPVDSERMELWPVLIGAGVLILTIFLVIIL